MRVSDEDVRPVESTVERQPQPNPLCLDNCDDIANTSRAFICGAKIQ
jgi:hypothetical protein